MSSPTVAESDTARRPLVNTEVLELTIDDATRDALGDALAKGVSSPYENFERALPQAVRIFQSYAPPDILAAIERFVVDPGSYSVMHITNMPVDKNLPNTPPDGMNVSEKKTFVSEGVMMGLGRMVGHPFAFKEEKKGKLIHQVAPVKTSATKLSNEGSLADLGMHVENSFSEFRPHYFLLFCLRGDTEHKAMTRLAAGKAIASRLSNEHFQTAMRPEFKVQCPDSFATKDGEKVYSEPIAIFDGPMDYLELRMDLPEYSVSLTPAARDAYAAILDALHKPGVVRDFDLQPGHALVIANRKVSHGRTVFQPRYDGTDRWLQRMYTISDPWQMRAHIDERLRVI